jgi:hypothetical protein
MPTISGRFRVVSPGTAFSSSFVIDGSPYGFQGFFSGLSIESCSGVVILTYDTLEHLTSSQTFSGVVGRASTKITLANGVEMSGSLETPISVANAVNGIGQWSEPMGVE